MVSEEREGRKAVTHIHTHTRMEKKAHAKGSEGAEENSGIKEL